MGGRYPGIAGRNVDYSGVELLPCEVALFSYGLRPSTSHPPATNVCPWAALS